MEYKRKKWIDEIVDEHGQVIQQGTPVNSVHLNNIEIATATAKNEINNLAAAIRETIPSGFTKFNTIDYAYGAINPNKIKLTGDGIAFVNGYKVDIPNGTIIDVGAPPTEGEREDLVFLEVWRALPTDADGETIQSRIRVVQGVDFKKASEGLGVTSSIINAGATAQGGNNMPLVFDGSANSMQLSCFLKRGVEYSNGVESSEAKVTKKRFSTDFGIYVAGNGDQISKDTLKTADGFVYAIPMFKVWRRNSGDFSDLNANGARAFDRLIITKNSGIESIGYMEKKQIQVTDISKVRIGDVYYREAAKELKVRVLSVEEPNLVTIQSIEYNGYFSIWNTSVFTAYNYALNNNHRPDLLYSNILVDNDVTDLRHFVSLTGFNYQQLLEENFDKLLRGELQTKEKEKMRKTYHGIRKTPIDANTVFYASFDGTTVAEVGGPLLGINQKRYEPSPIGLGLTMQNNYIQSDLINLLQDQFTLDIQLDRKALLDNISSVSYFIRLGDASKITNNVNYGYGISLGWRKNINGLAVILRNDREFDDVEQKLSMQYIYNIDRLIKDFNLFRVTMNSEGLCKVYMNGILIFSEIMEMDDGSFLDITRLNRIIIGEEMNPTFSPIGTIYDVSVSNIDRGDIFATLPQDFIDRYADIQPAFSEQRRTFSDAQTVQTVNAVVHGSGSASFGVTSTQAISGTWTSSDTIKVKGMAGELVQATPVVRALISNVATTIEGTWSGLNTNEATFILGTTLGLTDQDIYLDYNIGIEAGQGCIEVFKNTLAGEFKGKRLIKGTVAVFDDFKGKIPGSLVENPNIAKSISNTATTLRTPFEFTTEHLYGYNQFGELDSVVRATTAIGNKAIPQDLFSFNLIRIVEDKFGPIPSVDKVQWLKDNISRLTFNAYIYGVCPSGNVAKIGGYRYSENDWYTNETTMVTHSDSISRVSMINDIQNDVVQQNYWIDADGFTHFNVYTEASDGITPSVIYTDYVSIEIELKAKSGYDMLVPENPRRDDGISNVLLVRKETKEVESYFKARSTDGVITYGEYIPYQGLSKPVSGIAVTNIKAMYTSDGTGSYRNSSINYSQYKIPIVTMLPLGIGLRDSFFRGEDLISNVLSSVTQKVISYDVVPTTYKIESSTYYYPSIGRIIGIGSTISGCGLRGVSNTPNSGRYCVSFQKISEEDMNTSSNLNGLVATYSLCNKEEELYLVVATTTKKLLLTEGNPSMSIDVFKLSGRPLTKEV